MSVARVRQSHIVADKLHTGGGNGMAHELTACFLEVMEVNYMDDVYSLEARAT